MYCLCSCACGVLWGGGRLTLCIACVVVRAVYYGVYYGGVVD